MGFPLQQPGEDRSPRPSRVEAAEGPPAFDPVAFRRAIDDPELMVELVEIFEEDAEALLERMADAVEAGDVEALREAAHALRGMLGNFCADPAVQATERMSAPARRGDLAGASAAWPEVVHEVERLAGELRRFRDTLSS